MTVPALIAVIQASATRPGFGRIELQVVRSGDRQNADRRALTAATYRVAAELESLVGAEGWDLDISVAHARRGVIDIDSRNDAMCSDVLDELLIEACSNCDLDPLDLLVEAGAIDPGAR